MFVTKFESYSLRCVIHTFVPLPIVVAISYVFAWILEAQKLLTMSSYDS